MGYGKFGGKLLATHALMTVIQIFLYFLLFGVFENEIYQWIMGIFFVLLFWLVIYADASYYGQNDLKRGTFNRAKGFISGLIATIPGTIVYLGAVVFEIARTSEESVNFMGIALRLWLIPYIKIYATFESVMPYIMIVFILFFPIVSGISYLDGIRRRDKVLKAIEEREAMRSELSKRNR